MRGTFLRAGKSYRICGWSTTRELARCKDARDAGEQFREHLSLLLESSVLEACLGTLGELEGRK